MAGVLEKQMEDIINVPVNTARHNMQQTFKAIEDLLYKLPVHQHQAILEQLRASSEVRRIEAQNAIQEHQLQMKQEQERQQKIEAAKPKLVAN